jgi:H+-transporting ATPase
MGILVIVELMLLLHIGLKYFELSINLSQLQTFTFELLIYVELLDLLILRERKHFWNSRPSKFLLLAIVADLALVLFISIQGLPGVVPIPPPAALTVAGLSSVIAFAINDPVKVLLIRKFWPRG